MRRNYSMFYTCKKCLYTFEAKYKPDQCSDCGKREVREATEKEIAEYKKNIEEFKKNS